MAYNYTVAVKADLVDFIKEHDYNITPENKDELREEIYDLAFCDDSVTGNASGSYTMNRETAKRYVVDNMEALNTAFEYLDCDDAEVGKHFKNGDWEWFDCIIRISLVGEVIDEVMDEMCN